MKQAKMEIKDDEADAKQMKMVADLEDREAQSEEAEAREGKQDAIAIKKAAAITEKIEEARAKKELKSGKDYDAAIAAAQDEQKRENADAEQMEVVAANEAKDATDTKKDA